MTPRDEAAVEALSKPFTMQDVRLHVGEGKLSSGFVLRGVNIALAARVARFLSGYVVLPAAEAVRKDSLPTEVDALRAELAAKEALLAEVEAERDAARKARRSARDRDGDKSSDPVTIAELRRARAALQAAPAAGQDGEAGR